MLVSRKQNRRVLLLAAIIFLVFLVGSLLFVFSVQRQSESQIGAYLHDATTQRRAALLQQINGDFQVLRGVAVSLGEMDLSNTRHINNILDEINHSNTFVRMGLANPAGQVDLVDLSGNTLYGVDISSLKAFQRALAGQAAISETFYEQASGEEVNYYTVPIFQGGLVVGVLCAVNTKKVFWDIMSVPVFQGVGHFALIDELGTIIAPAPAPHPNAHIGTSIYNVITLPDNEAQRFASALQANTGGYFVFDIDGAEQLSVVMPLGVNNWSIISVAPHQALNSYYNQTAFGTSAIIITACLVFLFLLFWQIRTMANSQKNLEILAYQDRLTGLRNYTKLILDATKVIQGHPHRKWAVWSYDIKQFNTINDIFGIEAGDRVLKRVAQHFARDEDEYTFACRIAADQFAGLRPYTSYKELSDWFWGVYESLSNRVAIPDNQMKIDNAIGIYCVDEFDEELSVEEMLNRAAIAKKEAKECAGTQLIFFTKEMIDQIHWNAELAAGSRTALKNGELLFFLQPKISIQNGFRVAGAEALARWNHPKHGFISPAQFIPLFEENGFVVELDRHIFELVCQWYTQFRQAHTAPILISINVSRQGLLRDDFLDFYTTTKDKYGIGAGVLELEFTESVVFDNYDSFHNTVLQLQQAGFTCSIDDFGSGYSSLNVLKNLPIDVLKLDAVFFRDSNDPHREQLVVQSFISMANSLSIKTVAEGVETKEQVAFLQTAGCDIIQGYIFSKPLPPGEFLHFLDENAQGLTL